MSEGNGEIWGQLHALVAQFGPATVSEGIGVEEEYLFAMMSGQALMDREVQERLGLLVQSLGDAVDWSAGNLGALVSAVSPVVLEAGGAKPESPVGEGGGSRGGAGGDFEPGSRRCG